MKDCGNYYLLDVQQGSEDWLYMRKGRITMSNIGKIVGHAPYCKHSMEELASIFKGEMKEEFDEASVARMKKGNDLEPFVRDKLASILNVKIEETGFAVWKKDMNFGASLDGVINKDFGIEIKCPAKMYGPIRAYMENPNRDPNDIRHIWKSQYDQIIGNGVITGRKFMIFCVYAYEENLFFYQKVPVDYNYWDNFLYPKAKEFFDKYMK